MGNVTAGGIIKKSATYASAVVVNRALSFLLIPFYTRYLTTTDYGILELLDLTLNFTIVFAGSRLGQALFYFYFAEADEGARQRHMGTSFGGSVLLGLLAGWACWIGAPAISGLVFGTPDYAHFLRLTAVGVGVAIPMETCLCCLRALNEPAMYSGATIVRTLLAGVLNIILLGWFHLGVAAMLYSSIVSQSIIIVLAATYLFRRVPLRFDFGLFRKQAGYAIPLSVGSVGEFILNYGDRYFLRQTVPLSEIGIYSLAYKIGMVIPLVQYPFALFWSSQQVRIVHGEGGWRIYVRVGTYLVAALTAVAVAITLFVEPLLEILVTPGYRTAAVYAPWIALAYLIRAVGYHFREMFVLEKRPDLEARVAWIGTLVCLAGYALLIPRYGLWGAVVATVGSFIVVAVCAFVISQRLRRVEFEYRRFGKVAVSAVLAMGLFAAIRPESRWTSVAWGVLLLAVFGGALHWMRFWQSDEKEFLREKSRLAGSRFLLLFSRARLS